MYHKILRDEDSAMRFCRLQDLIHHSLLLVFWFRFFPFAASSNCGIHHLLTTNRKPLKIGLVFD